MITARVVGESSKDAQYHLAGMSRIDHLVHDHTGLYEKFLDHQNKYHEHLNVIEREFQATQDQIKSGDQDMFNEVARFEGQVCKRIIELQDDLLRVKEMFHVEQRLRNRLLIVIFLAMAVLKFL